MQRLSGGSYGYAVPRATHCLVSAGPVFRLRLPGRHPARGSRSPHRPISTRAQAGRFTLFESGQVRPLALSPSGKHLFAVNTPDNRLEVFRIVNHGPGASRLDPGRPRAGRRRGAQRRRGLGRQPPLRQRQHRRRSTTTPRAGRVVRTLLVGDEPRDIVFAGPRREPRVHHHRPPRPERPVRSRSSRRPASAAPTSGSSTRTALGSTLGGTPLTIVTLFTDTPRALAVTPGRQHASTPPAFHTGNRTTDRPRDARSRTASAAGRRSRARHQRRRATRSPRSGSSSSANGTHWVDALGRTCDAVREVLAARQGRVRASTPTPTRRASSPGAAASSRASAPSSTTWPSTR